MGKVPHRKRLTRRKDRDPRKRKRTSDLEQKEVNPENSEMLSISDVEQTNSSSCDQVSNSQCYSNTTNIIRDPVPLTPLVEKLKQHLRRVRYENSSWLHKNSLE